MVSGSRRLYQCHACHRQTSLTAGSLFDSTKLPLTRWFLAIYLISQAKTGLSALEPKRHVGVSYPTAWLMHHKIMAAMVAREPQHRLSGTVQVDDACLGGERVGRKPGRGSENKVPFVAAVSINDAGNPMNVKVTRGGQDSPATRSPSGPVPTWRRVPTCSVMAWHVLLR